MKAVISDPKSGKSYQAELTKAQDASLLGKKIGDKIEGETLGAAGYSFEIRGGSDASGFPMRKDISGTRKAQPILSEGPGYNSSRKGTRKKKTVRGNTVAQDTVQLNIKVLASGSAKLEELFPKTESKDAKKK